MGRHPLPAITMTEQRQAQHILRTICAEQFEGRTVRMAKALGVSAETLNTNLNWQQKPPQPMTQRLAQRLANGLGLTLADFLDPEAARAAAAPASAITIEDLFDLFTGMHAMLDKRLSAIETFLDREFHHA